MTPPALQMRFPCGRRYAARARRSLRMYLAALDIDARLQSEIESAVGEAIANALEHGYPQARFFEVRCTVSGDELIVEIEDDGPGFRDDCAPPNPGAMRGFGFGIMRSMSDRVHILQNGRLVRLTKRVTPRVALARSSPQ